MPDASTASRQATWQRLLTGRAQPPAAVASPQPAWLKALRAEALERVGALTVPTPRDEAWRFTDISALTQQLVPSGRDADRVAGRRHRALSHRRGGDTTGLRRRRPRAASCQRRRAAASARRSAIWRGHRRREADVDPGASRPPRRFPRPACSPRSTPRSCTMRAVVLVPRDTSVATPVHLLFIATEPGVGEPPAHPAGRRGRQRGAR